MTAISHPTRPDRHPLSTERLLLRPAEVADGPRLAEIQSDWEVARMLRMAFWPPDPEATMQWVAGHAEEWDAGDAYRFCIVEADRVVGLIDVDEIRSGTPHLGYWLHREAWGKGFAKEAALRKVQFAREEASLPSLTAGHAVDNPASGRVLAHGGFERVGSAEAWSQPHGANVLYHFWHLSLEGSNSPTARTP